MESRQLNDTDPRPLDLYGQYHGEQLRLRDRFRRRVRRLVVAKRICLFAVIGYVVFDPTVAGVLFPLAVMLIPAVLWQHWLVTRAHRHHVAVVYCRSVIARLSGEWVGTGDPGIRYGNSEHLYSHDLDIFGHGSLFELLSHPQTTAGLDTLASWLQQPADAATIKARQAGVSELRDQFAFRIAWDYAGALGSNMEIEWIGVAAASPRLLRRRTLRVATLIFAWIWVFAAAVSLWSSGWWTVLGLAGLVIEAVGYLLLRQRIQGLCHHGHELGLSLAATERYSRILQGRQWRSPLLSDLAATIQAHGRLLPVAATSSLGLLVQLPVAYFFMVQLVPSLEAMLLKRVAALPRWWKAVGQFEALCEFSAQAFERPDDCLPEIRLEGPCFHATGLAHPLIRESAAVRNDVRLDSDLRLLLVSGSNMSGKTTLLRTVGVNAVLALAGAPVRAHELRISPMVIGTAIRFQDSLERGVSYFYSVLSRLRQVLDALKQPLPLLFLLDEILQGTNSHDRLIGAEAVIRKLLASDAVGLVTTHDLELAQVAQHLAPRAANVHFADEVVDGSLSFDYRLRPGVVESSNALLLMRNMGLDV